MADSEEKRKTTEYAVAKRSCCDAITDKYGWPQAREPRRNGNRILPWTCTFEGDVKFPNYSEVDSDDN